MAFGDTLRNLIEELDITQKQLATDLKIAPSTIGGYVQNTSEPDFYTLKALARYFNVSLDYLLDFERSEITNTQNEKELLRIFRTLTLEQQELYIEQGKAFVRVKQKQNSQIRF